MYTIKFEKYNLLMGKIMMSEETTLEVLLDSEFDGKIPMNFKSVSPDEWAKYAFENNLNYEIAYYKEGKLFASVSPMPRSILFTYYEETEGELDVCLSVHFRKGYIDNNTKNSGFVPYSNGKVFLGKISKTATLGSSLTFYPEKKKDNVFLEEFTEENGKVELIEQYGTADLSKHWFDAPKHYLDYEHLIDYKKLFNELPTIPVKD